MQGSPVLPMDQRTRFGKGVVVGDPPFALAIGEKRSSTLLPMPSFSPLGNSRPTIAAVGRTCIDRLQFG